MYKPVVWRLDYVALNCELDIISTKFQTFAYNYIMLEDQRYNYNLLYSMQISDVEEMDGQKPQSVGTFFTSSDCHTRTLSCLLILRTVTQGVASRLGWCHLLLS